VSLNHLNSCGDEDRCGCVASVSTALTTLCADDVDTEVEALLDVLRVTDHVHVENAVLVELFDDFLGRNANGGDKELSTRVDDDIDELVQLALSVVVAVTCQYYTISRNSMITDLVLRALPPTWGSNRSIPNGAFLSVK
jgi:hypothetical protein